MLYLLHQYIILIETRSYTAASKILHMSQPALTKNIKGLEKKYNGNLIVRSRKGCYPTDFGAILYKHAKKIENEMSLLNHEMEKHQYLLDSHITIAFGQLWQFLYAAEIVIRIKQRAERKIYLTGKFDTTESIVEELQQGKCDIFLGRIPEVLNPDLKSITLLKTSHCIYAHKTHPIFTLKDKKEILKEEDLSQFSWMVLGTKQDINELQIPDSLKKYVADETIFDINSIYIILKILQKTNSLIILPRQVGQFFKDYDIENVSGYSFEFPSFNSGIIYRKSDINNQNIRNIIDIILEYYHSISKDFQLQNDR